MLKRLVWLCGLFFITVANCTMTETPFQAQDASSASCQRVKMLIGELAYCNENGVLLPWSGVKLFLRGKTTYSNTDGIFSFVVDDMFANEPLYLVVGCSVKLHDCSELEKGPCLAIKPKDLDKVALYRCVWDEKGLKVERLALSQDIQIPIRQCLEVPINANYMQPWVVKKDASVVLQKFGVWHLPALCLKSQDDCAKLREERNSSRNQEKKVCAHAYSLTPNYLGAKTHLRHKHKGSLHGVEERSRCNHVRLCRGSGVRPTNKICKITTHIHQAYVD